MQVYSANINPPASQTSTVLVQNIQYELMDFTPNSALANPWQWHFDPVNLNALCAKNPCPQPGAPLCQ